MYVEIKLTNEQPCFDFLIWLIQAVEKIENIKKISIKTIVWLKNVKSHMLAVK